MSQHRGHRRRLRTPGPPVRSIRSFKSSEQYLEAMKEDLAEWLRDLYGLDIDATNFLQVLETGLVLCRHANTVTEAALAFLAEAPDRAQKIPMPQAGVFCNGAAQPGTFQARDNISNFIQWCRKEMGIQEVLMFETEDLVLRKNVKSVLLCLLELGRRAWRFGVAAPALVHLEEEIDEELRRELALPSPDPPPPAPPIRRPCHFHNLDQMVQNLVSHCTCPVQFSMIKISEGKYRVGDSNTLIFIRILRSHVMVRVGGGWDTLGHYLDKHDPCRCTSLSHKPGSFLKPPGPPVQHEVKVQDGPSQPQPTMTISRSQSPLPPVDWKTYTSSSRKLRPPTPSSPLPHGERGAGGRTLREMASLLRSQERPMTPSQRTLSPSPQFSSTCRSPALRSALSGKTENRWPGELSKGRTPISWVHKETDNRGTHTKALTPQRLQITEATSKGTSARGPSPPSRSSSLASPHRFCLLSRGASPQLSEPMSIQSPPPSKGFTKIPIRLSPAQPPTPGRSGLGAESGGSMERGSTPSRAVTGNLDRSKHRHHAVEASHRDRRVDIKITSEMEDPRSLDMQKWRWGHAPLPLGRTREQAFCQGLEEEIVANMKLLEVGATCNQGTRSQVIPRSGVYVPSLGGGWPESGSLYDKVIQELVQAPPPLLKVDLKAWNVGSKAPPKPDVDPRSSKEKLGFRESRPRTKASLTAKGTPVRTVSSTLTVPATLEAPTHSCSDPSSDKARVCLGKGKRTLRKPQKIPSIYKLKLRPRIRPRRDHRPEKRPSRIPKPLAYLYLGPARTAPGSRLLKSTLGGKGGSTCQVDRAGEKEEEKKKEGRLSLENSSKTSESQEPQQLDGTQLTPEEESWV
ncbi:GAS2-like protein 2 [Phodopus roborovskii]|uniref:Gas2l2 protein n=1 Tax=Phodopus roborovskii TaxID=109678 RepID=A0AAU9YKI7_PHORO|nr:GAS2-like protein 2 [Phodopus roborovskii]CAH6775808.1 Gas2l2 [Phodopus roborovskii]